MNLFTRLFQPRAPATTGAQRLELRLVEQGRLAARTQNGTVIIDLRKAEPEALASGDVFGTVVADELRRLGGPAGLRVWVLPGAVLATWSSRPDRFAEILTDFISVACEGAPDVTVVAGPHQDASGVLQLMRNLGHQTFLVAADAPPPVVEVRLTGGGVIAGMSGQRELAGMVLEP